MALASFPNGGAVLLMPHGFACNPILGSDLVIDAAGESRTMIGVMLLEAGSGSKTISAAGGGKIWWRPGASNTFANASTNLRIGVQDLAGGVEDGTFDVYADLVGGTDTITNSVIRGDAMESGTKTLTHGTIYAVSIEMTARGGADSVTVTSIANQQNRLRPYATADTGSGPVASTSTFGITVQFDDGTYGWFEGLFAFNAIDETLTGSGSTPDERALLWAPPHSVRASGIAAWISNSASTDDFELILYTAPTGTPVAAQTISFDADILATNSAARLATGRFSTPQELTAGTTYGFAVRPTVTNTIGISTWDFGAGNAALRTPMLFGTGASLGTRTDQTGAFTSDTRYVPAIGVLLDQFQDGAGGSGGGAYIL